MLGVSCRGLDIVACGTALCLVFKVVVTSQPTQKAEWLYGWGVGGCICRGNPVISPRLELSLLCLFTYHLRWYFTLSFRAPEPLVWISAGARCVDGNG